MMPMINEEAKLKRFIAEHGVPGEHLTYPYCIHSVEQCVRVSGIPVWQIIKTIIFKGPAGQVVAAVVPAEFRVSVSSLEKAAGLSPLTVATPEEAYTLTGYPAGGTPCFGYDALRIVDSRVFEQESVYTGGGSEFSLTRIPTDWLRTQSPVIARIHGSKSN